MLIGSEITYGDALSILYEVHVKGNHADGDKVLQKKSCHEITPAAAKARSAQVLRNSPRAMSLTGYPSTRECPARYLMMPCQSLPDTRHRSQQIRRPAAQSKLRSSAQGCSDCFVPRAHYEMQTNRDFTLTRWSLIRVCSLRRNTKKPRSKTPRLRDPNRIQTYNLLIRSQMLYSVELWDHTRY